MLLAAVGGVFLFISIIIFVCVAIGTLISNEQTEEMYAEFAVPAPGGEPTPPFLQPLFRWGALALALAVLAYAGPVHDMLQHPGFLAPGMRTW
ncbi:MAG: hypothetical protein DLM50_00075 [Candidatus Meridianibacter frigidus]|nr:MAG: hypothetical protein DLM50_00075 [Candidatus Eremiobacteraeota bacterium]